MIHMCVNCEREWQSQDLKEAKDLLQRLTPGDIFPSGECPACSSLCLPKQTEAPKKPITIEDHITYLCAHLSDLRTAMREISGELRKKNNTEEARLVFNQKKQRLEALNFLKEEGLLDMLPQAKVRFKEYKNKELEGQSEEAKDANSTEAGRS